MNLTIPGRPITKKNSSQIAYKWINKNGVRKKVPFILPSQQFLDYQEACGWLIHNSFKQLKLSERYNLKCVYYMPTKHKVDLCNLLSATCDILVHYGVLEDDNKDIVVGHDGSRVYYDKENPRVEITIEVIKC